MCVTDEIARAFQAATKIPRSQLYGTEEDRQIPNSLIDSAQTPYVGFVGRKYKKGGTVLIAVNPGGGGDGQERTPGDAALEVAFLARRDVPPARLHRSLEQVTDAYARQLEVINIGKNVVSEVLKACKSSLDEVTFLNVFPYRTKKNDTPAAAAVQRALDVVTEPLVNALGPSRIVFLGKKAKDIARDRLNAPTTYTVHRTFGDRYLSEQATRVLAQIKSDCDEAPRASAPLPVDTATDKAVRFGCGALMGVALMAYLLVSASGGAGTVLIAIVVVLVCGALAVTWSETFFERIIRLFKCL
jgi:hypothetical protein